METINQAIQRDKSIDWLKGLAIFLVVMGHELQWCTFHLAPSQLLANGNTGLVQQWISSFHMPLLFFLSGFLVGWKKQTEEPSWSALGRNILRKMQTILLPGVTWMIVKHFIMGGWYIEWFLKVLFVIFVLFVCVRFISQRLHWHFVVEAVAHFVLFGTLMVFAHTMKGTPLYEHLCLRSIGGYYPYFCFGVFFSARGWNRNLYYWKKTIPVLWRSRGLSSQCCPGCRWSVRQIPPQTLLPSGMIRSPFFFPGNHQ